MQNTKTRIFACPPIIQLAAPLYLRKRKICKPIDSACAMSPWLSWEPYNCPRPRVSVFLPVSLPLPAAVNDKYYKNFASVHALYLLQKFCLFMNTLRGAGATGAAGTTAPLPKHCGGSTGATCCPFCQTCISKFVHYSQKLEFRTIFKQCLKMRYSQQRLICLHFGIQNIEFYSKTIYIFMILEYDKLSRHSNQVCKNLK